MRDKYSSDRSSTAKSVGLALVPYFVFWTAFMAWSLLFLSASMGTATGGFPIVPVALVLVNLASLLPIVMMVLATLQGRTTLERLRLAVFGTVAALMLVNSGVLAYIVWEVYLALSAIFPAVYPA